MSNFLTELQLKEQALKKMGLTPEDMKLDKKTIFEVTAGEVFQSNRLQITRLYENYYVARQNMYQIRRGGFEELNGDARSTRPRDQNKKDLDALLLEIELLQKDIDSLSPEQQASLLVLEDKKKTLEKRIHDNLRTSMSHTKRRFAELAICNEWEYAVTLTLDPKRFDNLDDVKDLSLVKKKIGKWFNNIKNRKYPKFQYIIVPERHEKGGIHFHGFISGIPREQISFWKLDEQRRKMFNWYDWDSKFGFNKLHTVDNKEALTFYFSKYFTKDLILEDGHNRFIRSKGLNVPEVIFEEFNLETPMKRPDVSDTFGMNLVKTLYDHESVEELISQVRSGTV